MGCSTCSSGAGGTPTGCRNNGTCGTGGCNKLNIYNWLSDMVLPQGRDPFQIIEVRFKGSRKEFYRNRDKVELKPGDVVAVDASPGHDIGIVSIVGELVRLQLKKKNVKEDAREIRDLYRMAKPMDIEKWEGFKQTEEKMIHRTREIISDQKISMKLSDVEMQGDGKKATFYYTADDRVDFRSLIVKLAEEFRTRVEMRQIGLRQEAGRLGGIGSCGRELCCSTWLTDFKAVTTGVARYQNLALNPLKLAGQCGKLKCCLNYELDSYLDAIKDIPENSVKLETKAGKAYHRKTDIFKRLMWYSYQSGRNKTAEGNESQESDNWIMLTVDRVKEIIDMNKQKVIPPDLAGYISQETEHIPGYKDMVGQDSLTRMDNRKSKKKRKKKKNRSQSTPEQKNEKS
jgi:cell fate regulator YaaT (PSP1 superfamily)